jgi:hypothetical protein
MANEFKHGTVGTELTQAEYEAVGGHVVDSQAIGDLVYASSTSQLIRLGIGSTNDILMVKSGIPDWEAQTQITSVGTIATGTWQGTAITSSYINASQTGITAIGTIATGTWQGTAIASAYLDSDTAHLSGTQTFTGAKTFTNTITVGVDDDGKDVKFFGETADSYMLWDESADRAVIRAGTMMIGGAETVAQRNSGESKLDIHGSDTYTRLSVNSWSADEKGAYLQLATSQSDTIGTMATTADTAVLGYIRFEGVDTGNNFDLGASIHSVQVGSAGVRVPADLRFTTSTSSSPTEKMRITTTGSVLIGDDANTFMTQGVTINMGANDDSILSLKSSDVAHGITTRAETDTYASFQKDSGSSGGLAIYGLTENESAFYFEADYTNDDTGKATTAHGAMIINARKKSGTGLGTPGSDANLMVIRGAAVTKFIFDQEGSAHAEVEWITFDKYDDLALVKNVEHELLSRESKPETERRKYLESTGIIGKDSWRMENGKPKAMVNMTKLAQLHHGALIQVSERLQSIEEENRQLKEKMEVLDANN